MNTPSTYLKMGQDMQSDKPSQLLVYQSRDLFRGDKVVVIVHAGRAYRLSITRSGKLILTA